jgi:hypothetical protein
MNITISFNHHIQDSVSVGDIAYYTNISGSGGFVVGQDEIVVIGEITFIDRVNNTITCSTELTAAQVAGLSTVFILFSKNNCQEGASLLGYFGSFKFKNNSTTKAELFAVTVDAFESSK